MAVPGINGNNIDLSGMGGAAEGAIGKLLDTLTNILGGAGKKNEITPTLEITSEEVEIDLGAHHQKVAEAIGVKNNNIFITV